MADRCHFDVFATSLGWMAALASDRGIRRLVLPKPSRDQAMHELRLNAPHADHSPPRFDDLRRRLEAYFLGADVDFEDELDLEGASDFMVKAWKACRSIPKGEVRTYSWLAEQAGNRRAARAAGMAMSRNPAAIIIPCHRVIGSNGSLHGYAGGLPLKQRLLEIEGALTVQRSLGITALI